MTDHAERFWAKVEKHGPTECWPWTAAQFHFGHGAFKLNGRPWGSHRIAWELTHGPVPVGFKILHHCDNPPCCNPAHLYVGTLKDNGQDMAIRGRTVAKLTVAEVRIARLRYRAGESIKDIVGDMPVGTHALEAAIHGESWGHIAGAIPRPGRKAA